MYKCPCRILYHSTEEDKTEAFADTLDEQVGLNTQEDRDEDIVTKIR